MNATEYFAEQQAVMVAAERLNLAATVRNRHNPGCPCASDQALTEPINPKDAE